MQVINEERLMNDWNLSRINMVENQIKPYGIKNLELLRALESIPRELFFENSDVDRSYSDQHIILKSLDEGSEDRFVISPVIFSKMIEIVDIQKNEVVLDIGCANGYSSAIISHLADTVVAIDQGENLTNLAEENLYKAGINNVVVVNTDIKTGYAKEAPYDVIVIEGSVDSIPNDIYLQLNTNGRIIAINADDTIGKVTLYIKDNEIFSSKFFLEATVPYLTAFKKENEFLF
ncbi:MAG: protein-L-isoaspartate(D-aspartate) O-methyltransferase [Alphaproteobacteria bacterium]|jgi:protein-L-isoaspartate(D-aspartate) O-methyltransferase|tara:strand:+ start:1703 stop:2401 length:699 start_codon:yes stop_codon:yes gene_type:complete